MCSLKASRPKRDASCLPLSVFAPDCVLQSSTYKFLLSFRVYPRQPLSYTHRTGLVPLRLNQTKHPHPRSAEPQQVNPGTCIAIDKLAVNLLFLAPVRLPLPPLLPIARASSCPGNFDQFELSLLRRTGNTWSVSSVSCCRFSPPWSAYSNCRLHRADWNIVNPFLGKINLPATKTCSPIRQNACPRSRGPVQVSAGVHQALGRRKGKYRYLLF